MFLEDLFTLHSLSCSIPFPAIIGMEKTSRPTTGITFADFRHPLELLECLRWGCSESRSVKAKTLKMVRNFCGSSFFYVLSKGIFSGEKTEKLFDAVRSGDDVALARWEFQSYCRHLLSHLIDWSVDWLIDWFFVSGFDWFGDWLSDLLGQNLGRFGVQSLIRSVFCRLIKQGVDVNARHQLGWTPLHLAAVNGRSKFVYPPFIIFLTLPYFINESIKSSHRIVQQLIDAGADVNSPDQFTSVHGMSETKQIHYLEGKSLLFWHFFQTFFENIFCSFVVFVAPDN